MNRSIRIWTASICIFVRPPRQKPSGIAKHDRVVGNVPQDDGIGAHHRPATNPNSTNYLRPRKGLCG